MNTLFHLFLTFIFFSFSLSAMDIEIKREFTVTQIMLDLQQAQMEEEYSIEDHNTSIEPVYSTENM